MPALLLAVLLTLSSFGAALGRLPSEYVIEDHGRWSWASPFGKVPPSPGVVQFIDDSLLRMRARLGLREPGKILVVYTGNRPAFSRVLVYLGGGEPRPHTLAVAFPGKGVMVVDGALVRRQPLGGYSETIGHELAHLIMGGAGPRVPRWYHEGVAQWLSGARLDWEGHNLLAFLARDNGLEPLSETSFPRSHRMTSIYYRQSLGFVSHLSDRHGEDVHARILAGLEQGRAMGDAFREVTGELLAEAEHSWFQQISRDASWIRAVLQSLGLFHILALFVIMGFGYQWVLRRRRLRSMAREEAAVHE